METVTKIIGMLMVIVATSSYGFVMSRDLKLRLKELKELKKIIFLLKGEISFGHTPLFDAFDNVSYRSKEPIKGILNEFVQYARTRDMVPFIDIWNDGMPGLISRTHLSKDEIELFLKLGSELGLSDIKTQQNAMDNFLCELDINIESLERETPNKVKLYNSMGIMSGIVIAIIMI